MMFNAGLMMVAGAVVGGLVGYSGMLCPDGSCAITGSWYGGATFGAAAGLALGVGGCPICWFGRFRRGSKSSPPTDPPAG